MNNEETAQLFILLDRIATALEAQIIEDDEIQTSPLNDLRRLAFEAVTKAFEYDEEASKNIRIGAGGDRYQEMSKAFDDAMKIILSYRRATQMLLGKTFR